jgi:hypothetical protein
MRAGLSREATLVKTVMEIKWIVLLQTRHATARVGRNEHSRRSPFRGGNDFGLFPGLKTWAILLDHFMVTKQL